MSNMFVYRLAEEEIVKHITITDPNVSRGHASGLVQAWFLSTAHAIRHDTSPAPKDVVLDMRRAGKVTPAEAQLWSNDASFLLWSESVGASVIAHQLKVGLLSLAHQ